MTARADANATGERRRVLAITGIRSEYDILKPVLSALVDSSLFEVAVVLSGAHLSGLHGSSGEWVERDGFAVVDRIDSLLNTERATQRPHAVANLIGGLTQTVDRENPDFLLVVGDREEALAAAIVGNYMQKVVVHIAGGDTAVGNADDPVRTAVSKLAHIHFVMAAPFAKNLDSLGEESFRIAVTGNPANSGIAAVPSASMESVSEAVGTVLRRHRFVVFLMHPFSSSAQLGDSDVITALVAVTGFASDRGLDVVAVRPNSDPGAVSINAYLNSYAAHSRRFIVVDSLPQLEFVNLMRNALCLVGNSSMGILEAPAYALPVVNIGPRQVGRLNAGNVRFVSADELEIREALDAACFDAEFRASLSTCVNPYGDESAAEQIVQFLETVDSGSQKWLVKQRLYAAE